MSWDYRTSTQLCGRWYALAEQEGADKQQPQQTRRSEGRAETIRASHTDCPTTHHRSRSRTTSREGVLGFLNNPEAYETFRTLTNNF